MDEMTNKMYTQSEQIKERIESLQKEHKSLTVQQYIDMTIEVFKTTLPTPSKRLTMYNYLHSNRMERYGGNWYWLLRRIRNTGQITRLQ